MKNQLRLEQIAMFLIGIIVFKQLEFAWWWFPLLLLTPDFSMLGYLAGPAVGAASYNLFHHKAVALAVLSLGYWLSLPVVSLIGVILWSHSSMDRIFGYGLKYPDDFKHTHMGWLEGGKTEN